MVKGYTDSEGKITFLVEEGVYSWKISKDEHGTKWGRVTVTKDTTIEIELLLLPPPISLSVMTIPFGIISAIGGVLYSKGEKNEKR